MIVIPYIVGCFRQSVAHGFMRSGLWFVVAILLSACDLSGPIGRYTSEPFGTSEVTITSLSESEFSEILNELNEKLRVYLQVRETLPFANLASESCSSVVSSDLSSYSVDVSCAVEGGSGIVAITEQSQQTTGVAVVTLTMNYQTVSVNDILIEGEEIIEETLAEGGASIRTVNWTYTNGESREQDYTFRMGLLDQDVLVMDYTLSVAGKSLRARVTNPTAPGVFVDVYLLGVDATVRCELRDVAWILGDQVRAVCDNGMVIGLSE